MFKFFSMRYSHKLTFNAVQCKAFLFSFLLFSPGLQKCYIGETTGLVAFKKHWMDLFTIIKGREVSLKDTFPVEHYREFYPFSRQEDKVFGAVKFITDKQKGKATYFIFETRKMLNRKTKLFNLFFPKFGYRVFPNLSLAYVSSATATGRQNFLSFCNCQKRFQTLNKNN